MDFVCPLAATVLVAVVGHGGGQLADDGRGTAYLSRCSLLARAASSDAA